MKSHARLQNQKLEKAYRDEKIDALLLLLADDSKELLQRKARELIDRLQSESLATSAEG